MTGLLLREVCVCVCVCALKYMTCKKASKESDKNRHHVLETKLVVRVPGAQNASPLSHKLQPFFPAFNFSFLLPPLVYPIPDHSCPTNFMLHPIFFRHILKRMIATLLRQPPCDSCACSSSMVKIPGMPMYLGSTAHCSASQN